LSAIREFFETLRPYWSTLALLATWTGISVVYLRRRWQWQHKRFLTLVNFSLNYVRNGTLAMRTLLERPASQVWPNEHGVRMVLAAAQKTTVVDPFIVLRQAKDMDFANRAVLNVLSERFADTFLAASLGAPARTANFCFAITCEKYEDIRTLKLRVLLVEEQTLMELFGPKDEAAKLEITSSIYRARLQTLRGMHRLYVQDRESGRPVLGEVELGVVV
jgi:hypothetical protein